eukprot:1063040-Rhodomonas_salina.2
MVARVHDASGMPGRATAAELRVVITRHGSGRDLTEIRARVGAGHGVPGTGRVQVWARAGLAELRELWLRDLLHGAAEGGRALQAGELVELAPAARARHAGVGHWLGPRLLNLNVRREVHLRVRVRRRRDDVLDPQVWRGRRGSERLADQSEPQPIVLVPADADIPVEDGQDLQFDLVHLLSGQASDLGPYSVAVVEVVEHLGCHHRGREQEALEGQRVQLQPRELLSELVDVDLRDDVA